ncbi:unnamed protein product, partial [Laminaria digitata]
NISAGSCLVYAPEYVNSAGGNFATGQRLKKAFSLIVDIYVRRRLMSLQYCQINMTLKTKLAADLKSTTGGFFLIPFIVLALLFSLPPSRNSGPINRVSKQALSPPSPLR